MTSLRAVKVAVYFNVVPIEGQLAIVGARIENSNFGDAVVLELEEIIVSYPDGIRTFYAHIRTISLPMVNTTSFTRDIKK